jgi:hypothetical protein
METNATLNAGETECCKPKSFARYLPTVARILMGLIFLVFGLNGFLHFIPQPKTPMPEGAVAFAGALGDRPRHRGSAPGDLPGLGLSKHLSHHVGHAGQSGLIYRSFSLEFGA